MSIKKITPNLIGVQLIPGVRYMINPQTAGKNGAPIFPYDELLMKKNPDLIEFYPKFREVAVEMPTEVIGGDTEGQIEIEEVVIDIPVVSATNADKIVDDVVKTDTTTTTTDNEPLKPWQIAQLAKKKKAEEEKVLQDKG